MSRWPRRCLSLALPAVLAACLGSSTTPDASAPPDGSAAPDGAGAPDAGALVDASALPDTSTTPDATDATATDAIPPVDAADAADATPDGAPTPGVVAVFDGATGYVEIPDDPAFSQPTSGAITVEAWMRPDSLSMPSREGSGYVHWLGKGTAGQHEWTCRMYQTGNAEGRNNRVSFYAFNPAGGLGAGSYFEDALAIGTWIHVVGQIDATSTYMHRDGVLRDSDPLAGYAIVPVDGTAPLRIGTRDLASFFQGGIARVAIYGARLPAAALAAHYAARSLGTYDALVLGEASLVAYWKLDETSGTVARDSKGAHDGAYHGGVTRQSVTW